jgi:hypothetical protein
LSGEALASSAEEKTLAARQLRTILISELGQDRIGNKLDCELAVDAAPGPQMEKVLRIALGTQWESELNHLSPEQKYLLVERVAVEFQIPLPAINRLYERKHDGGVFANLIDDGNGPRLRLGYRIPVPAFHKGFCEEIQHLCSNRAHKALKHLGTDRILIVRFKKIPSRNDDKAAIAFLNSVDELINLKALVTDFSTTAEQKTFRFEGNPANLTEIFEMARNYIERIEVPGQELDSSPK